MEPGDEAKVQSHGNRCFYQCIMHDKYMYIHLRYYNSLDQLFLNKTLLIDLDEGHGWLDKGNGCLDEKHDEDCCADLTN